MTSSSPLPVGPERLDLTLLQNSPVILFYRPELLAADLAWLETHGYR